MLQVMSVNVNGIRSAFKKGLLNYLKTNDTDIVCVQDLKAQPLDLSEEIRSPEGYHGYFEYSQKKGYGGVGIYSKKEPVSVQYGLGLTEIDAQGRFLRVNYDHLSVLSWYLPSGDRVGVRQEAKLQMLDSLFPILKELLNERKNIIICGDWNIARGIDIGNEKWRNNPNRPSLLLKEEQWLTKVLQETEWVDIWRTLYPDIPGHTWWSIKPYGWRIDYQMLSPQLAPLANNAYIYEKGYSTDYAYFKEKLFSDHAPLVVEYVIDSL